MHTFTLDTATRKTVIHSIHLYQKYISPRKGFACPHRTLHKETSCSEYVKQLFVNQDLISAIHLSSQRFQDCSLSSQALKTQKSSGGCIVIPCCIPI